MGLSRPQYCVALVLTIVGIASLASLSIAARTSKYHAIDDCGNYDTNITDTIEACTSHALEVTQTAK